MGGLLLRFVINVVGLLAAAYIVPGVHFDNWVTILVVALIFGVVNALIKPLIEFFTCLINVLTLGLFTLIINTFIFWLSAVIADSLGFGFRVDDFWSAFFGALIVSLVSLVLTRITRRKLI